MFERFTERARQVVVLAQDEARALGHAHIGTEHLLLGLLRTEEGAASRTLHSLGVEAGDVRERVRTIVGEGDEATAGKIPFTPGAKKTLELALREALAIGHNYIGSEHLLLAVVRMDEGVGSQILRDVGLDAETVRDELFRALGGERAPRPVPITPRRKRGARLVDLMIVGWILFALALGVGILIGWAIWHH